MMHPTVIQSSKLFKRLFSTVIRPVVAVEVALFRDKSLQEVLYAQRANEPDAGKWACPGGKVEFGEELHEAGARELWEETGIRVELDERSIFWTMSAIYHEHKVHSVIVHTAAIAPVGAKPVFDPVELLDARWVGLKEVERMDAAQESCTGVAKGIWMARDHLLARLREGN